MGIDSVETKYRYVPTMSPASARERSSDNTFSVASNASRAARNAANVLPSTVAR